MIQFRKTNVYLKFQSHILDVVLMENLRTVNPFFKNNLLKMIYLKIVLKKIFKKDLGLLISKFSIKRTYYNLNYEDEKPPMQ